MRLVRIAALAASLAAPAVAFAAEAEGGGAGMPQLNVATYTSQIVWLAIAFVALYWLLSRKALPAVAEVLEARQDRISSDLDRAAKLRQEAEEATRRYDQVVLQAETRAQAQIKEVRERVAADAAKRQAELDAQLAIQIAEAEARIGKAKDEALAGLHDVALEVSRAAVQRLIGADVDRDTASSALRRVLERTA